MPGTPSSPLHAIPACKTHFKVHMRTEKDQAVRLVGSCHELGCWDLEKGVLLIRDHETPSLVCWKTARPVYLPMNTRIDYAYDLIGAESDYFKFQRTSRFTVIMTDLEMMIEDYAHDTSAPSFDLGVEANPKHSCVSMVRPATSSCRALADKSLNRKAVCSQIAPPSLLIISYELPLRVVRVASKGFTLEKLRSVVMPQLHTLRDALQYKVQFIGCCGIIPESPSEEIQIRQLLKPHCCIPVFPDPSTIAQLHTFNHETLWPFFHNIFVSESKVIDPMTNEGWTAYTRLNRLFASIVQDHYVSTDLVWIHDNQLLLLPLMLRETFSGISIGLFLHVPFPSVDIFGLLPMREELLEGMLACNLIGFHFFEYARHFLMACKTYLSITHHFRIGGMIELDFKGRNIMLFIGHVHLQYDELCRTLCTDDRIQTLTAEFLESHSNKFIFASVDRCEWLSGIHLKLLGFQSFLRDYQHARSHALLIQWAYPSNDVHDSGYSEQLEALADEINGEFGDSTQPDKGPVILKIQSVAPWEKYALYCAASCFLDTSTRNGFNMNPFEFIACHANDPVSLILSEFTGCCNTLASALRVNPWRIEAITHSLDLAMRRPSDEASDRFTRDQMYIQRHSTIGWAHEFIADLLHSQESSHLLYVCPGFSTKNRLMEVDSRFAYLDKEAVYEAYKASHRRVFFFDHEGTLAFDSRPFTNLVGMGYLSSRGNAPNAKMKQCLKRLCSSPCNTVVVVSGRDCGLLDKWFQNIPGLGLCAELGYYSKIPELYGANWQSLSTPSSNDFAWRTVALDLMHEYVKRTQGTFIENKGSAIVFQYRDADFDLGSRQAKELASHLEELADFYQVDIVCGKGYVEVRLRNISKGTAVERLLTDLHEKRPVDFVLCIGDDRSDEDMFPVVNKFGEGSFSPGNKSFSKSENQAAKESQCPHTFTVTVGKKASLSHHFLTDVEDVSRLLNALVELESVA